MIIEQTDAGFVDPALDKLPHQRSRLAGRNEDENTLRGSVARAAGTARNPD
jgi:hypothetical protein